MTAGIDQHDSKLVMRSDFLKILRQLSKTQKWIGPIAQFTIVVDANIILGDLIWLVCKRKNLDANTELMECIYAGTIVAYSTRQVLAEVEKEIPNRAGQYGRHEEEFHREWVSYKQLLKIKTPPKRNIDKYISGRDPDDAPSLGLADVLKADGVLTKDEDLVAMGGFCLQLDFTRKARDYSRQIVVSATIKYGLGQTGIAVYYSVNGLVKTLSSITKWVLDLPVAVKVILLAIGLAAVLHPKSKQIFYSALRQISEYSGETISVISQILLLTLEEVRIHEVRPPIPVARPALPIRRHKGQIKNDHPNI